MGADFTGYVTRYGVKCSDGRTIQAHAFKHNDGMQIPLVWQHQHNDPTNILGHVILRHVDDGVRGEAYFNSTPAGQQAKDLVKHKDIRNLSIYANQLVERQKIVHHGNIREASLVLSGANPGAFIDDVNIVHGDGTTEVLEGEVFIFTDDEIEHSESTAVAVVEPPKVMHAQPPMPAVSSAYSSGVPTAHDGADPTAQEVLDGMTDQQKAVVYALLGQALTQSDEGAPPSTTGTPDQKGDEPVTRNVFDQTGDKDTKAAGTTLTHADVEVIFSEAKKCGSLRTAVEAFALSHGIDDIDRLFPFDQAVTETPEFISRRMEWVAAVLANTRKTPFARIRSWSADITFNEARAKGFVKGSLKREEFFRISKRVTTPQTVYKKQKLDRDDIIDITEFDVVMWLKTEMRLMLDEELARAILIGDGRDVDDPDKIDTANVRPIYGDDELYTTQVSVDDTAIAVANTGPDAIVDAVVKAMRFYRGSGSPTMYTTRIWLAQMLLAKDTLGRRLYPTSAELSAALGVANVIACEALESKPELIGLVVNLIDYTVGADRGGEVNMFDFFDIDYNQFKYLMECRMSGALTKYRSALAIVEFSGAGGLLPDPAAPTFDDDTGIGTIPAFSGLHLTYVTVADDGTESSSLTAGAQAPIAAGAYVTYRAVPDSTYSFSTDANDWTFRRNS